MGSGHPRPWLSPDTETGTFLLPPSSKVAVQVGAYVHAGDTLATLPPLPQIIAFGESLRLSLPAGRAAIQALDGTSAETGTMLGTHRVGFRTRSLPAPCSGSIRGVPDLGAVAILPANERRPLRASRPGMVAAIDPAHITITSHVLRCRPAYLLGAGTTVGRFTIASTGGDGARAQRPDRAEQGASITAIPYLGTVADFTAALRSARGPIIVGAVSETVAWEMLANPPTSTIPAGHAVAVLIGPSDREGGMRVIEHLRDFDGATFALAPQDGELTIFPKHSADERWVGEPNAPTASDTRYRDPARWHAACVIEGETRIGLLGTGARTLLIRTGPSGDGSAWAPVVNVAKCPVS